MYKPQMTRIPFHKDALKFPSHWLTLSEFADYVRLLRPARAVPLLVVALALLLWALALPGVDLRGMGDLGLVTALPVTYYTALAMLIVGFALNLRPRQPDTRILLLYIVVIIFIVHGTPAVLYGTLRYSWAWKHIGIVDYIQRHLQVDFDIVSLNAYHNWPGFFTLSALISEVAGLDSPLAFASWAPVFFNLIDIGALLIILKSVTRDPRLIWLSVLFFYLTNWVGQDYFSPQAMNYFLHLVVVGVCLRWFSSVQPPARDRLKRWLRIDRLAGLVHRIFSSAARDAVTADSSPVERTGLMAVIILVFAAIASSHQLTPFMTIGAVMALVIFRRCNARTLPVLLAIIALVWISFVAVAFVNEVVQSTIEAFGQLSDNLDSNLVDLSNTSDGQRLIAMVGRGLSMGVWGMAFLGGLRRLRKGHWDIAFAMLAVAPFSLLAGNSYGGEIMFRIYFFALPFMTFFNAAFFLPTPQSGRSWITTMMIIGLSAALLGGFFFAYYGKEAQYYFTQEEIEASQFISDIAPENTLLIEGSRNYPSRFQNYEYFVYVALSREHADAQMEMIKDPAAMFTRWMSNDAYAAAYLIITRSQKAEVDALGEMPPGTLDRIERTLMDSPDFEVIYKNRDVRIFVLVNDGREGDG